VAASGNAGSNFVLYPARYEAVMAVAATDNAKNWATFSNYGPEVDVAAPGVSIYSLGLGNNYTYKSGTSMAAPHVAGLAAVLFGLPGNSSAAAVRWEIETTALDLGAAGPDVFFGAGLIQMDAAIQTIPTFSTPTATLILTANFTPTPTATSTTPFTPTPASKDKTTPTLFWYSYGMRDTPTASPTWTMTPSPAITATLTTTPTLTATPVIEVLSIAGIEISVTPTSTAFSPSQPAAPFFSPLLCGGGALLAAGIALMAFALKAYPPGRGDKDQGGGEYAGC
jgi:hypothetical protein